MVDAPSIAVVEVGDSRFPARVSTIMGAKTPKKISWIGNFELIYDDSIGFCGSRSASEHGLAAARDCAIVAAECGITVVSGNAKGIDRAAHRAALAAGGRTILVLPEGLARFRVPSELAAVWDWRKVLVISQFPDEAIWRSYQAMERNRLIIGLSYAMCVIESGSEGGTWNAAMDAIRMGVPLFVVDYREQLQETNANDLLIKKGGIPLRRSGRTGLPKLAGIVQEAERFKSQLSQASARLL